MTDLLDFNRTAQDPEDLKYTEGRLRLRQQGHRAYWPDEEPEREYLGTSGVESCSYCLHEGHKQQTCPERPMWERTWD